MAAFWFDRGRSVLGSSGDVREPTFKVFCEAVKGSCLAVSKLGPHLELAPADPTDEHQHWFKDTRFSMRIKDEEGNPVFSLVNKATGLAVQHPVAPNRPVRLLKFDPDCYVESTLWTESGHLGKNFGSIRMMQDVGLALEALPDLYGGNLPTVSPWRAKERQRWKILYWNDEDNSSLAGLGCNTIFRLYCKGKEGFSATVRGGFLYLAPTNPRDKYQHWIQDWRPASRVKDQNGYPAFALVNKFTGEAIKSPDCDGLPVKLVPYNPFYLDVSVLWSRSRIMGRGFSWIHMVDNISLNLSCDNTRIVLSDSCDGDNLQWFIGPWSDESLYTF